jgi:hypothetical protein
MTKVRLPVITRSALANSKPTDQAGGSTKYLCKRWYKAFAGQAAIWRMASINFRA